MDFKLPPRRRGAEETQRKYEENLGAFLLPFSASPLYLSVSAVDFMYFTNLEA